MSFHESKNLYFDRGDDGSVTIRKYRDDASVFDIENGESPIFEQTIESGPWCSIISSMSAGGESDYRWFSAGQFHKSTGQIDIVSK